MMPIEALVDSHTSSGLPTRQTVSRINGLRRDTATTQDLLDDLGLVRSDKGHSLDTTVAQAGRVFT